MFHLFHYLYFVIVNYTFLLICPEFSLSVKSTPVYECFLSYIYTLGKSKVLFSFKSEFRRWSLSLFVLSLLQRLIEGGVLTYRNLKTVPSQFNRYFTFPCYLDLTESDTFSFNIKSPSMFWSLHILDNFEK